MLVSWLLSDTWLMTIPARLVDTIVCALALWLISTWCRCTWHSFGRAVAVSAINSILGISLYTAFVWVRDTGAVPWRNPWYLIEVFLAYQALLLFFIIAIAYRRDRWRAVITALATPIAVMGVEALAGLLLSVFAPHVTGLLR
jgi:hypothetical protein